MKQPYLYFMANKPFDEIRIGHTGDKKCGRIETHKKYGYKVLAVMPATVQQEDNIHTYFKSYSTGRDNSHYHLDAVFPYVQRLLDLNWASKNEDDVPKMSPQPWALWSPEQLMQPIFDGKQACLFITEAAQSRLNDIWQTPSREVNLCREALGGKIDLDPASCFEANQRVRAEHFYDERTNGLIRPWHGSVFLNPPYGGHERNPIVAKFIDKLIQELTDGNITRAITILNLQSVPTLWFPRLRLVAKAHAIYAKRIQFIGPKAKSGTGAPRFSSSKNGTIFSFFGEGKETFKTIFKPHSMVFEEEH